MPVLSREEFLNRLNGFIGNRADEEAISFLEDLTDTYNGLESKANGDGENWKQKFEENDKAWQARYRNRFMSGTGSTVLNEQKDEEIEDITGENIMPEDLFKEEEI